MITIPEHHMQHEIVLGDPQKCTYGQQSAMLLLRIHEILLLADTHVPGRAPSDLNEGTAARLAQQMEAQRPVAIPDPSHNKPKFLSQQPRVPNIPTVKF